MKKSISPELAEILGLLCSEGCHVISFSNYWEKERGGLRYRKNKLSERIEFYNKDINLLQHYRQLIFKEFGLKSNITKWGKINIGTKRIIKKIIAHTELGHLKWKVPKRIINSDKTVKVRFIRGFFDGDGTASKSPRFFSTNKKGITQLSELLTQVGFKNKFNKPMCKENRKILYVLEVDKESQNTFYQAVKPISKLPKNNIYKSHH